MQGLWQRRKVNLNAVATAPSTSATPTPPPVLTSTLSEDALYLEPVPPSSRNTDKAPSMMTTSSSKHKLCSTHGNEGSTTKRSCVSGTNKYVPPAVHLADLGGVDPCVENMLEFVSMPLAHLKVYLHTSIQPLHGVLLHGLPSCGKTMLVNAISRVGPLPPV